MTADKTKWVWTTDSDPGGHGRLPPLPGDSGGDDLTRPASQTSTPTSTLDQDKTRVFRPKPQELEPSPEEKSASEFQSDSDPVVGWLVVVKGRGMGRCMNLGIGANTIGRDQGQRVVLDFGDSMISRTNHATVLYDDRDRTFYIQHGEGKNLTRINGTLAVGLSPLKSGDTIELGPETTLRFVPFCGPDFDWAEVV